MSNISLQLAHAGGLQPFQILAQRSDVLQFLGVCTLQVPLCFHECFNANLAVLEVVVGLLETQILAQIAPQVHKKRIQR